MRGDIVELRRERDEYRAAMGESSDTSRPEDAKYKGGLVFY